MDKFKKYLLENKSRLEPEEPPEEAWDGIKIRISRSKRNKAVVRFLKWTAAACIITLAGIGVDALMKKDKKTSANENVTTKQVSILANDGAKTVTIENMNDTVVKSLTQLPKKIKNQKRPKSTARKETNNIAVSDNFLDQSLTSIVAAIENQKTIISSTPIFGVVQDHFVSWVMQYKELENAEQKIKNKMKVSGVSGDILDEIIKTLKRRMDILLLLKAEIDKVNDMNRDKVTGKIYLNII